MHFINRITGQTVTPEPWQLALKIGDYYINEYATLIVGEAVFDRIPNIYGQLVDQEDAVSSIYDPIMGNPIDNSETNGFFWAKTYSQWFPDGELRGFNICEATRQLTAEEFDQARENGWP
ncbi:MAG: hypothetical protein KDJ52_00095 [Anaerolineae bacterium]|nr:hypothetical protein [Anaerolineae bacterium]